MPKRKITAELWQQLLGAYNNWEPGTLGAPGIDDLIAPFGVSKQAFYSELNRQGVPLKGRRANRPTTDVGSLPPAAPTDLLAKMLLEQLIATKMRVVELERALLDAGIPIPA